MPNKQDIRKNKMVLWDRYTDKQPADALKKIYDDAEESSAQKRGWYWDAIKDKKLASFLSRGFAFFFLVIGTALPLLAGLGDEPKTRLLCTQVAITLLAIAGLIRLADQAFGWSSGWMRYMKTVNSMESSTTIFEFTWAKHLVSKPAPLDHSDVLTLFAVAEQFEHDLIKLYSDETDGWITEFTAGINLLDSAIKEQNAAIKKEREALRTAESTAQTEAKAQEPGAIDLTLIFKNDPRAVSITLDGSEVTRDLTDTTWSSGKLAPGIHTVVVRAIAEPTLAISSSLSVETGKIAKADLNLPF